MKLEEASSGANKCRTTNTGQLQGMDRPRRCNWRYGVGYGAKVHKGTWAQA